MPLFEFKHKNKYGQLKTRIVYQPTSQFKLGPGFGDFVSIRPFRYMSRSPYNPGLVTKDGKKYMIPDWIEVLPETSLDDIKPYEEETRGRKKGQTNKPKDTWQFESSSDKGMFYKVTKISDFKYRCSCPGTWRAKDRRCKHIKAVENGEA